MEEIPIFSKSGFKVVLFNQFNNNRSFFLICVMKRLTSPIVHPALSAGTSVLPGRVCVKEPLIQPVKGKRRPLAGEGNS